MGEGKTPRAGFIACHVSSPCCEILNMQLFFCTILPSDAHHISGMKFFEVYLSTDLSVGG